MQIWLSRLCRLMPTWSTAGLLLAAQDRVTGLWRPKGLPRSSGGQLLHLIGYRLANPKPVRASTPAQNAGRLSLVSLSARSSAEFVTWAGSSSSNRPLIASAPRSLHATASTTARASDTQASFRSQTRREDSLTR